jgi:aminopeptidase
MRNHDVASFFNALYLAVKSAAEKPSLFQTETAAVRDEFEQDFASIDALMEIAHQADRLTHIFAAGLEHDAGFQTALKQTPVPSWKDFTEPPADRALQDGLADRLYYQKTITTADKASFSFGEKARYVGMKLIERALADRLPFVIQFDGMGTGGNFGRLMLNHCPPDRRADVAALFLHKYEGVTKSIGARCDNPTIALIDYDAGAAKEITKLTKSVADRTMGGQIDYCVTYLPTEKDAEKDEIPYDQYVKLFFELCDQPWAWVDQAQQHAIRQFDRSRQFHITTKDGTDLRGEFFEPVEFLKKIAERRPYLAEFFNTLARHISGLRRHFTFCNSLVARNVPGSEIFSAPRRDSLNGVVVAKGKFEDVPGKTIRDLTLHFKKGKLVKFEAAEGAEHFQEFLDRDPGNYYVGEFGKGTNPHLRVHVMNGLLVEKIGPSFHLAFGKAYTYKQYMGVPVHVDNGNRSIDHWDITAMLTNGGRMELDGKIVMENGRFTDPKLAVLNDGWAAVPVEHRPDYWKDFKGYGAASPLPV